ncbi:MAG TPA: hypothetical protein VGL23_21450, partial [Chloroflexota bacterium]
PAPPASLAVEPAGEPAGLVFERSPRVRGRLIGRFCVFAAAVVAIAAVLTVLTPSPWAGRAVLLVGLLGLGVYWSRWRGSIDRVVVSRDGLEVLTSAGRVTRVPWGEIGWLESRLVRSPRGDRVGQVLVRRRDGSALDLPADLPDLDLLIRLIHAGGR